MLAETKSGPDNVSNIHRRWNLTRLNPESYKTSLAILLASVTAVVVISHVYYFRTDLITTGLYVAAGMASAAGAKFLDHLALRGIALNRVSKVTHVAAFSNLLWALTIVLGIASNMIFAKDTSGYIIEGLFLAAGLKIGIFTSVLGASIRRALGVAFIQPLILMFVFIPPALFDDLITPYSIGFGLLIIGLGVTWSALTDKAGRPKVDSTFGLLQAYLSAQTENKADKLEAILEGKARDKTVVTKILSFESDNLQDKVSIILPDIHPGPLNPVGGSDLPHLLYKAFAKNAMVMHSISDHSLNLPSKKEVEKYIKGLQDRSHIERGNTCSVPVQVNVGKATTTGIAFGKSAFVMLSFAPAGMEDVPYTARDAIEHYSKESGFSEILLIDSHNAMGIHLSKEDEQDLTASAIQCLERLFKEQQYPFVIGFSNSEGISNTSQVTELAAAGLAVLAIDCNGRKFAIGWADANNMEKNLRNFIISEVNKDGGDFELIEICTSDTHSLSGKRNREGYYALGDTTSHAIIADMFKQVCRKASNKLVKSAFDLASNTSNVKVMGEQFDDYSFALDKSMTLTKIFTSITFVAYVVMLVFTR